MADPNNERILIKLDLISQQLSDLAVKIAKLEEKAVQLDETKESHKSLVDRVTVLEQIVAGHTVKLAIFSSAAALVGGGFGMFLQHLLK